jgi:hypothetical protein
MRIPNTERFQYYTLQFDHFELAPYRDLVRRSSWSPGYYGIYVPLLTRTLEPERVKLPAGMATNAQQPPMSGQEPDAGKADS